VSFASPLALLGLLAVPALCLWYVGRTRARVHAMAAFTAPRLAASAIPHQPGWRRHLPMVAFLLAILAIVLAAARPRITLTTTVAHLQTMLALDMSGSMQATDIAPTRAGAAQHAADLFVSGVPAQVAVGVMQFNQAPLVLALPTQNHQVALDALGRLRIGGGTAIGNAIQESLTILKPTADPPAGQGSPSAPDPAGTSNTEGASAAIVLLSDGKSTSGPNSLTLAREAARLHIPIFTVSLGTPTGTISVPHKNGHGAATVHVPVERRELAEVAQASGGRAYTAADADHLSAIYRQLSARLSHHRERRDITAYLAGAGLGLLLLGSALTIAWFGRLI
jgi:Ca-activated chloride channel family protein